MEKVGKEINVFSSSLYKAIDLGLPSGALWADKNIGAATPEDAGLYFQWGDTQGYTAEQVGSEEGQKYFDWSDYKFSIDGSSSNFSKYNASDSKTVLEPEDDAAHVNMGGNWRMPTFDECKELFMNTDVYLVQADDAEIHATLAQDDENGLIFQYDSEPTSETFKGMKFYKKEDHEVFLFVPAGGYLYRGSAQFVGVGGFFYSSSLSSRNVDNAWSGGFDPDGCGVVDVNRCGGMSVRGIMSNI